MNCVSQTVQPLTSSRQEEWPAGAGGLAAACLLTAGEELHQGHLWLPGPWSLHHTLCHPEELPIRPWGQLLCRPWPCWAGRPPVAWSWLRVALLCALGLQTLVELCQGERWKSALRQHDLKLFTWNNLFHYLQIWCWFFEYSGLFEYSGPSLFLKTVLRYYMYICMYILLKTKTNQNGIQYNRKE